MSNFKRLHVSALMGANWEAPDWQQLETTKVGEWLLERHSMTERLKACCETLTVEVIGLYEIKKNTLSEDERALLGDEACLVREVVLSGDEQSWLCARTLVPKSTLTEQEKDIADLGAIPLGQRVFNQANARRDAIEVSTLFVDGQELLARRSRLWVNDKPMLVSELFLPHAPIYQEEG
ncbi:chorismate--pyruvate lyase family protein [Enterovibrio nigricans]|uniref:Probable chorismate pyruvate-lyase n=1 Tax=Enterovibrio nigricans DSM 22720 TaxID=1121868 RepID=A0A1T4UGQ3_9GAMM|nr:chorismate lyase [Enterovibrio nigricans]PKF51271.1 chorismate lyase [Enterovibrio nigricans]SKA51837.1 chorismate lyase [Enterovibrio nigricans DSM 22720]